MARIHIKRSHCNLKVFKTKEVLHKLSELQKGDLSVNERELVRLARMATLHLEQERDFKRTIAGQVSCILKLASNTLKGKQ